MLWVREHFDAFHAAVELATKIMGLFGRKWPADERGLFAAEGALQRAFSDKFPGETFEFRS